MAASKRIAVTGATGNQGGAVIKALLSRADVQVRALTRHLDSEATRHLAEQGVEVVQASYDDPSSLVEAFHGCSGAFLLTTYWDSHSMQTEVQHGKALADACKAALVNHVVWSGLEDTRTHLPPDTPRAEGDSTVPLCDGKAEVTQYMLDLGLPVTTVIPSNYMENFKNGSYHLQKLEDGLYGLPIMSSLIDQPVPWIAVEDIGRATAELLHQGPEKWAGKTVGIATEHTTYKECVDIVSKVVGHTVQLLPMEPEDFCFVIGQVLGPKAARGITNLYSYFGTQHCRDERPLETLCQLVAGPVSFKAWAEENKQALLDSLTC